MTLRDIIAFGLRAPAVAAFAGLLMVADRVVTGLTMCGVTPC